MNIARGYRRLAIATIGSWLAAWGAVGGFSAWQQSIWSEIFIEASRAGRTSEMILANQRSQEFAELVSMALTWGLLAIPFTIAFSVVWWVYKGFAA